MLSIAKFDRFRQAIASLPLKERGEKYERAELMCSRFLLFSESGLDVYYIPFHYVNRNARVVLMGLTPGWTQMEEAFRAAKQGIAEGLQGEALFRHITRTGSFSGSMRKNLVDMLDGVGLNTRLAICSCSELFSVHDELVHFTSAVSVPIFKKRQNYQGYGPCLLQVHTLRRWLLENLAVELKSVPRAIIVPLGRVADEAIDFLDQHGLIDLHRCLTGFPHPSGANGHRKQDFEQGRKRWTAQILAWFRTHR
jgi:hypothetical protein